MKQFFVRLYYRLLYAVMPRWLRQEFHFSLCCETHAGLSRCDCVERYNVARLKRAHAIEQGKVVAGKDETIRVLNERLQDKTDTWEHRYYAGFAAGKKAAIDWHLSQANVKKMQRENFSSALMKQQLSFDERIHSYCAEEIKLIKV